jgi:sterol desaturase/sphingolipid hydroxylase (fatty acid hydroxylase superfamily)
MHGLFEHSCTKINLGAFRNVVADNRFHRIHHSIEAQHWNKNFGAFTSIWDRIFGTAHFPKPDEWPETGVAGEKEPMTIREFLFMPFRASTSPELGAPPAGSIGLGRDTVVADILAPSP